MRLRSARAFLFDLDGVLTPTVEVHMRAWERLFAPYLAAHRVAPYTVEDYHRLVDGRPRYDGVRAVLEDRHIRIPEGGPDDPPDADTVHGLGNRKNAEFSAELAENGIAPYSGSLRLLDALAPTGIRVAVVTSSRNGASVLKAAGIADRVEVLVDGIVAADDHLRGKPAPDAFLDAARRLGLPPEEGVVLEDALSGVAAGHAGGFGLVVGVDRGAGADALRAHGADIAVSDLAELLPWLPTGTPRT
ncbi:MAG: beta-phosphoglucomutase family hydrolase [Micrococcales bacterium]|nr:beta-phosphoglucomutase family hydrolase [Micrococcales bacterium]